MMDPSPPPPFVEFISEEKCTLSYGMSFTYINSSHRIDTANAVAVTAAEGLRKALVHGHRAVLGSASERFFEAGTLDIPMYGDSISKRATRRRRRKTVTDVRKHDALSVYTLPFTPDEKHER